MMRAATRTGRKAAAEAWTILVVEDEVLIRTEVAAYLRQCGYRVIEARNASEAREVLGTRTGIDLVLSAVEMPGRMNGFGLASWIRRHHPALKVLLASGIAGAAEKAGELCSRQLGKPHSHQRLADRIRRMLAR
jgi:DNA-binding NtrC family response regulator